MFKAPGTGKKLPWVALWASLFVFSGCGGNSLPIGVTVKPSTVSVRLNGNQSFSVSVSNSKTGQVTWSVGAGNGGTGTYGSIDANGNYTAPAAMPAGTAAIVTATSEDDPSKAGTATVSLLYPIPIISNATATQAGSPLDYTVEVDGAGFVPGSTVAIAGAVGFVTAYKSSSQIEVTNVTTAATTATFSVTVTNPLPDGMTSNAWQIELSPTILVSPTAASATVSNPALVSFVASVYGTPSTALTWSVGGVPGGGSDTGTISPQNSLTAFFTAPQTGMPASGPTVTINASIGSYATATATVNLLNPTPILRSVTTTSGPTLAGTMVSFPVTLTGTNFVSSANAAYTSLVLGDSVCTITNTNFVSTTQMTATVQVPSGASACTITVKNQSPDGAKTATSTLTLPTSVTLSPATGQAIIGTGTGPSFKAIITGTTTTSAVWSVDNGAAYGTASPLSGATSTYIPPNQLPASGNSVTLRASAAGASGIATITLSNPQPPSGCQYTENPIILTVGQSIGTDVLTCSGGGPVNGVAFSPAGSLAGVTFNTSTGSVSGTPTEVTTQTYTVTPSNQGGNAPPIMLSITINPQPPANCTYPNILGAVGVAIMPVTPTCTSGGAPTAFVRDPSNTLPYALSVSPVDGTISGIVDAFLPPQTYTIDLSNSGSANPTQVTVQISAGNLMNLTTGSPHWGVDGHIDKGGPYTDVTDGVQTGLPVEMEHIKNIFGPSLNAVITPNSIMYRMSDYVTGCDGLNSPPNCDPETAGSYYKQSIDTLEQDGVIVPLMGLITYPQYDAPCGGITPSFATSSREDMYNWAHCTALNALNYVPENMYWYIGNEWYNQGPLYTACIEPGNDACGTDPDNWRNARGGNYGAYLGAMAGAIAAIRETSPQAKIVSGGSAGSVILGFSLALLQDLQQYQTSEYPNGHDLTWDYTSVHWGADAAQDPTNNYARYYANNGFADMAYCHPYCDNQWIYYDAYTTLYLATGKPLFVDEFTSSDAGQQALGNPAAATTDSFAADDISALMDNFQAHSLAAPGKELGIVAANFYELYQQPCATEPCDDDHFLYSYDLSTSMATLQPQGKAVQKWMAIHGNPSVSSDQTPPFAFATDPSQVSVAAGTTTTITIPISSATGTPGQGVTVGLTCSVMVSTFFTLPNVATCQVTNAGGTSDSVGSAVLAVTTPSGLPNRDFYYIQVIGSATTSSGVATSDKIVQVCINSCPVGVTVGH